MEVLAQLVGGGAAKKDAEKPKRRVGRTIDPAKVVTFNDWVKAAKAKYINIAMGADNALLVLDPGKTRDDMTAALAAPVKTIPHVMGADYAFVLAGGPNISEELRVVAEAKREAVKIERDTLLSGYQTTFQTVESGLLTAVDNWNSLYDVPSRRVAALAVGEAIHATAKAEAELRAAKYPHRYVENQTVRRMLINPATGDPREQELVRYYTIATSEVDRGVSV